MSEPPADPALLFTTPPRTKSPPARQHPVPTSPLLTKARPPTRSFFVAPPVLPSAEKRQYKGLPASFKDGVDFDETVLDAVVGQHVIHGTSYYFVRFKDGIAHRVSGFIA
jgi:chromodomain-helicase-DNA-binding protein 4